MADGDSSIARMCGWIGACVRACVRFTDQAHQWCLYRLLQFIFIGLFLPLAALNLQFMKLKANRYLGLPHL
jgi:hypothetical protein